jgi:tRNA/rRNA methyltransferase
VEGRPRLDPRALAEELSRRSGGGDVAVVFGEERRGLSDAELDRCEAVCTIPTSAAYDSMNLAHAVAVVSYELAMAAGGLGGAPASEDPARHETMEAIWDRARALLAAVGYLNPQNPELVLAELRRVLARAEPTQREAELIAAAVRALERALRRP